MPYVTEEIYSMITLKSHESIMISDYPIYNKDLVFTHIKDEELDKINFISKFRNVLKENNIYGDYQVSLNTQDELIINMLKLSNRLVDNSGKTKFNVKYKDIEAIIYYDKVITEEEQRLKEKQIEELKNSINKRTALLNNENFVSKAPENLVLNERKKLEEEKELLAKLTN